MHPIMGVVKRTINREYQLWKFRGATGLPTQKVTTQNAQYELLTQEMAVRNRYVKKCTSGAINWECPVFLVWKSFTFVFGSRNTRTILCSGLEMRFSPTVVARFGRCRCLRATAFANCGGARAVETSVRWRRVSGGDECSAETWSPTQFHPKIRGARTSAFERARKYDRDGRTRSESKSRYVDALAKTAVLFFFAHELHGPRFRTGTLTAYYDVLRVRRQPVAVERGTRQTSGDLKSEKRFGRKIFKPKTDIVRKTFRPECIRAVKTRLN